MSYSATHKMEDHLTLFQKYVLGFCLKIVLCMLRYALYLSRLQGLMLKTNKKTNGFLKTTDTRNLICKLSVNYKGSSVTLAAGDHDIY